MFTVCPKCALTLVVTAADLRVAQGYVRCGRCSSVFNALARLTEERQSGARRADRGALSLSREPRADPASARAAAASRGEPPPAAEAPPTPPARRAHPRRRHPRGGARIQPRDDRRELGVRRAATGSAVDRGDRLVQGAWSPPTRRRAERASRGRGLRRSTWRSTRRSSPRCCARESREPPPAAVPAAAAAPPAPLPAARRTRARAPTGGPPRAGAARPRRPLAATRRARARARAPRAPGRQRRTPSAGLGARGGRFARRAAAPADEAGRRGRRRLRRAACAHAWSLGAALAALLLLARSSITIATSSPPNARFNRPLTVALWRARREARAALGPARLRRAPARRLGGFDRAPA